MTATATAARTCRVFTSHHDHDSTFLGLVIRDGVRFDGYYVLHAAGSCEVRWEHEHDRARQYVVTCSPADGSPYRCSCPARHRSVICRHRAATTALAEAGYLELPKLEDAGHDRGGAE